MSLILPHTSVTVGAGLVHSSEPCHGVDQTSVSLARRARCCAFGCLDGLRATRATSRGALSTSRELARAATPGRARSPAADGARSSACAEFFKYWRARGEHKFPDGREPARLALSGLQDSVSATREFTRARWDRSHSAPARQCLPRRAYAHPLPRCCLCSCSRRGRRGHQRSLARPASAAVQRSRRA